MYVKISDEQVRYPKYLHSDINLVINLSKYKKLD
jgi:hypothetical protein